MEKCKYDLTDVDIFNKNIICETREQAEALCQELGKRDKRFDIPSLISYWERCSENIYYFFSDGIAFARPVRDVPSNVVVTVKFDDLQGLIKTEIDNYTYDLSDVKNSDLYETQIYCDKKEHAIALCKEINKRDDRFKNCSVNDMISWHDNKKTGLTYVFKKLKFQAGVFPSDPFKKQINFLDLPGLKKYVRSPMLPKQAELKHCEKYLEENSTCNELVKCSECIHFTELKSGDRKFDCDVMYGTVPVSKDGCCSYGEKKEQLTRFKDFSDEEVYILMAHIVDYVSCDAVLGNENELLKKLVDELVMEYHKRRSKEVK